uniref:CA domain-containing protein n=1 Tax=Rhabditophanes sp. KR3021 TaxID=114890 RepID=A0AC35UBT2_9BILA
MLIASDIGELLQNVTTFKIEATDGGGMTSHEHAVVNIIPFEQHNLIFTERIYYYNVSEDILPGIAIGNVFLRDQNYDDVDLEIYGGNSNSLFAIESDGSITVLKYLNTNHRDSFLLNVLVQDKKNLRKNYCQVEFRIIDMNNHVPEMDKEMIVNVLENYPLHEPFYAIFATDKDRLDNGRVTFEILNSDPPSPVVIRPLTGELVLAASLDYELIKNYQLKVKATDQGLPPKSSISVIYLNVVDVNNMAPIFESQLYTATINEDAPTMTEIVTVKATDGDSGINAKVYYSIVQDSNKFDETFGINKSSGLLFLRKTLDREIISEYHLTVSASDRGSPQLSSNCTVQIKIVDINDNIPNCASIQSPFYLSELQDLNTALGKIAAYDPDLGDNGVIYYRLQQTNENFEVRRNGEIYLRRKAANICELNVSNKLSVIAEDAGTPSLSSVCLIDIRCEHESAKVKIIEPFNNVIYVPSKCADGCFAKKINATNAFQYNLVKDDVSNHFIIRNDNEIWIKAGNIFEETDLQKSKRFNLDILDDNQRKKRVSFLLKSLHVSELVNKANKNDTILLKLSEKLLIGTKLAVIGKKPDKYYYKMVNKDPHVLLNEEEGTLFLSRKFEYADQQIHEIRVRRFSRDPEIEEEHNEFNVIIEVIEENTHYPFFTRNIVSFNVSEDSSPGLIIGRVNASDIDSGINGAVNYKIKGSQSLFTIDDVTGEIFLQQKLDYHSTKQHFVVIEAIDRSGNVNDRKQSACTVLINVLNSNHAPIFVSINNITVPENQLSSEPFHFVSAVDKDNDESLYYEIDKTDNFRIDNKTGAVYLLSRSGLQKQIITVKGM